ncbi:MAG TPA: PorP/SprF family type IX secretion system membrane protein [Bacteroidia bacterium]|jgi:type IX secretion system PorP/SprF family membrane protein
MKKKIIYTLLAMIAAGTTKAQDFHLAQYDAAGLYMNPALTGMFLGDKGDYRISSDYRSQWKALGIKPYNTVYLAYDMPYTIKDKKCGFGAYVINSRSGNGHFNTFSFMLSGAYDIMQGSDKHYLSAGLQLGLFNKSFDPSSFTYDVQYDASTGTFDNSVNSMESGLNTSIFRFDANMGIYYKYRDESKKWHPYGGFSIYHVNRPNETFTAYKERLPMRFNFNAGCDFILNERFTIVPKILYMNEAKVSEFYAGLAAFYKMKDNNFQPMLGLDYRHKDAFVVEVGLKQDKHIFRISYDVNTSYLNSYTGGRGAIEFSLVLIGIKGQPLFIPPKSRVE